MVFKLVQACALHTGFCRAMMGLHLLLMMMCIAAAALAAHALHHYRCCCYWHCALPAFCNNPRSVLASY
jgi:hypothetical protein